VQLRKILSAGFGGAVATAVDVSTLVLLVHRGAPVALAAFAGCALGAAAGFSLNKYVAFRDRSRITWKQLARFGFVAVANALIVALAMAVVVGRLGVPYLIAKAICAVVVFVAWTDPAQRRLVFGAANVARSSS
jgi:putative flippase GtrA